MKNFSLPAASSLSRVRVSLALRKMRDYSGSLTSQVLGIILVILLQHAKHLA